MQDKQDKREEIINRLKEEGLNLRFSSPQIRNFWVISKAPGKPDKPSFEHVELGVHREEEQREILPDIGGIGEEILRQEETHQNTSDELTQEEPNVVEEPDFDSMSPKEFKKFKKEKEREAAILQKKREKEEKEFNSIRKDAHKRGYDTSVLMQLDSPDQLYDFSNEEIDQIQAAGYINDDGFYDFVYPPDAEDLKREAVSTRTLLLIGGLVVFVGCMLGWMFSGLSGIF